MTRSNFNSKVAIVTGGSRGIGRAIAERIGRDGASVAISYVSRKDKALNKASIEERGGLLYKWGTAGIVSLHYHAGALPVRNYTTNIYPEHGKMGGQYLRGHFEHRKKACWACQLAHNRFTKVTEGPYEGIEGEEPEY